jgi:hypothetical protein
MQVGSWCWIGRAEIKAILSYLLDVNGIKNHDFLFQFSSVEWKERSVISHLVARFASCFASR